MWGDVSVYFGSVVAFWPFWGSFYLFQMEPEEGGPVKQDSLMKRNRWAEGARTASQQAVPEVSQNVHANIVRLS